MIELEISKCKPKDQHLLKIWNRYKLLFEEKYIWWTLHDYNDSVVLVKWSILIHNNDDSNIIAWLETQLEPYLEKVNNYYLNL